jgi:transcriptional regulator with XRE-family HTH domain
MEFNEKLQELRKARGLTQEELAEALFVSRTAISKWESGRGYPSIDSLKAIAKFFGVSIDMLLSCEEALDLAEKESKRKEIRRRDLVFGLLDVGAALLLFLPFFGQGGAGNVESVSLLQLTGVSVALRIAYFAVTLGSSLFGILTLALQNANWCKSNISLILNAVGVVLFIITRQVYGAVFLFVFLAIKALMLIKNR